MTDDLMDPIVVEPPGFSTAEGWAECSDYVKKCGGLTYDDGEPNWRAAFGADPGICSCPACHQKYWAWGMVQRCRQCGFQYPTDWWPMYSYGVSAATAVERGAKVHIHVSDALRALHERRMESHAYYRYGYEHPVKSAWEEHERIDWRAVFPQSFGVDGGRSEMPEADKPANQEEQSFVSSPSVPEGRAEALRVALVAARDALAAFGKQAGWLPEQQAYSCTMTQAEKELADAVASIDEILADDSTLARAPQQPARNEDDMRAAFAAGFEWHSSGTDTHGGYNGAPVEDGFGVWCAQRDRLRGIRALAQPKAQQPEEPQP